MENYEFGQEEEGFRFGDGAADAAGQGAAASASHAKGKQSLFEGYQDPSKQFPGQTRSYRRETRYQNTKEKLSICFSEKIL